MALPKGYRHSAEARAKMAEAKRGKPGNHRTPHTEETKRRISAAKRGVRTGPPSQETREKLAAVWTPEKRRAYRLERRGIRYDHEAVGSFIEKSTGYRRLTGQQDHPLSRNGSVLEHRKVLYDKIGSGPHECYWKCGRLLEWGGIDGICADHLDEDRLNNSPDNLVPSCMVCNIQRGR